MPIYLVHLTGQRQPIEVDLPFADIYALSNQASHSRFVVGHLAEPDTDGVCRPLMISTSRIECALEGRACSA